MDRYFGSNSNFNHAVSPLNLPNDDISLFTPPRDYDPLAMVRHYDESMLLRYLISSSSSSDENATPRNHPAAISSNQLRRLSSSSSGGCLSPRGSPLSPLENLQISPLRRSELASSAAKIEEEVLVVDAVPVRSGVRAGGGIRSGRMRTPFSLISDSGALPSPSSVTGCSGLRKRAICRSWEDFSTCRYGAKCVFAHGKEELDPRIIRKTESEFAHGKEEIDPRIIMKTKSDFTHGKEDIDPSIISKTKSEFAHGKEETDPCIIIKTKSEFAHGKEEIDPNIISKRKSEINMCKSASNATIIYGKKNSPSDKAPTKANLKEKGTSLLSGEGVNLTKEPGQNRESSPSVKARGWSPLDDGFELTLPYPAKNPTSREAVDEYINRILYGPWPSEKRRLPVFEAIFPNVSNSSA